MFKAALERGVGNYGHMENPASAYYRTPVEWEKPQAAFVLAKLEKGINSNDLNVIKNITDC